MEITTQVDSQQAAKKIGRIARRVRFRRYSMTIRLIAVVAGFGLIAAGLPVQAHHSFAAEFDSNKPVKLTGAVTRVEWMNPHAYFYLDVKDESGTLVNWALEMGSICAIGFTP